MQSIRRCLTKEILTMAKLTYGMIVSLDGYVSGPPKGPSLPIPAADLHQYFNDQMRRISLEIYGRRMYEAMRPWGDDSFLRDAPPVAHDFAQGVAGGSKDRRFNYARRGRAELHPRQRRRRCNGCKTESRDGRTDHRVRSNPRRPHDARRTDRRVRTLSRTGRTWWRQALLPRHNHRPDVARRRGKTSAGFCAAALRAER